MIIDRDKISRILVIKLRGVGDVLLSTVVTKNLRLAFPRAVIEYLTEQASREVITGNPYVDGVVVFDRKQMTGLDLIRTVRAGSYDIVIDLFGNPRTALVTRLSGARYRVGFRFRFRSYAYNIPATPRGGRVHNTQFNLDALEALGVVTQDRNLYFQWTSADDEFVDRFLQEAGAEGKTLAAINASGGWYTKRWSRERFARLADRLAERYGVTMVLTWGPGEELEVREMAAMMHSRPVVPPPTSLKQLGALFKRCAFLVSNDSGPMHIAAAVGVPVLGIYGPTNPVLQGPYGNRHIVVRNESLGCLGCNLTACTIGHPCMLHLHVDTVFDAAERLLTQNRILS